MTGRDVLGCPGCGVTLGPKGVDVALCSLHKPKAHEPKPAPLSDAARIEALEAEVRELVAVVKAGNVAFAALEERVRQCENHTRASNMQKPRARE